MPYLDPNIQYCIDNVPLPSSSKFMGYCIRIPSTNDLLMRVNFGSDSIHSAWTKFSIHAKLYPDLSQARYDLKRLDNPLAMIGYFFDLGEHNFVVSVADDPVFDLSP